MTRGPWRFIGVTVLLFLPGMAFGWLLSEVSVESYSSFITGYAVTVALTTAPLAAHDATGGDVL